MAYIIISTSQMSSYRLFNCAKVLNYMETTFMSSMRKFQMFVSSIKSTWELTFKL